MILQNSPYLVIGLPHLRNIKQTMLRPRANPSESTLCLHFQRKIEHDSNAGFVYETLRIF